MPRELCELRVKDPVLFARFIGMLKCRYRAGWRFPEMFCFAFKGVCNE